VVVPAPIIAPILFAVISAIIPAGIVAFVRRGVILTGLIGLVVFPFVITGEAQFMTVADHFDRLDTPQPSRAGGHFFYPGHKTSPQLITVFHSRTEEVKDLLHAGCAS
jgi:hypothetical protein